MEERCLSIFIITSIQSSILRYSHWTPFTVNVDMQLVAITSCRVKHWFLGWKCVTGLLRVYFSLSHSVCMNLHIGRIWEENEESRGEEKRKKEGNLVFSCHTHRGSSKWVPVEGARTLKLLALTHCALLTAYVSCECTCVCVCVWPVTVSPVVSVISGTTIKGLLS